jgi:predicted SAM-dependent methyltransferase
MSREDWEKNTIKNIFGNLYPYDVNSILDIGCGISNKAKHLEAKIKVGVDIYRPYLEKADGYDVYLNVDANNINKIFMPKSFDVVLLMDIVEHLYKFESTMLIRNAEAIARKAVIIETPDGEIKQNIDIWGLGGHEWQTHRCYWTYDELINNGYTVLLRPYEMQNVKRHTEIDNMETKIKLIDAIKVMK